MRSRSSASGPRFLICVEASRPALKAREKLADVEAHWVDLVVAIVEEPAGCWKIRRRVRYGAVIVRVSLDVPDAADEPHCASALLYQPAVEIETAPAAGVSLAAVGIRRSLIVVLCAERCVQSHEDSVDVDILGIVEILPETLAVARS